MTMTLPWTLSWTLARTAVLLVLVWVVTKAACWLVDYRRFRLLELAIDGPRSLPVLGNALSFLGIDHNNILAVLTGLWGERRDDISRTTIFNQMLVFVTHPDDIARVIQDRAKRFNDKPWFFYSSLADFLGTGSASASGDQWKAHRAITQPTFSVKILDGHIPCFSEETQEFVRQMLQLADQPGNSAGVDVYPFETLHHAIARGVMRTTMSLDVEPGDDEQVQVLVDGFENAVLTIAHRTYNILLWPSFTFWWTSMARFQRKYNRAADEFTVKLMIRKEAVLESEAKGDRTAAGRTASKTDAKSFLDHVIEAKMRGEVSLSQREIVDEVKTIFSAGIETSTTTTCFVMKVLSVCPDVQDRAFRELHDVLGDSDRAVTAKDLSELVYLERVLKETLRMFPSLPIVARAVKEDAEFNGKTIPAGSVLLLNIIGVHRDGRFHKDPLHFDPDRFEPGRSADRHPFCYLPFSAGPRDCVGQRSAILQVKTAVANILRAFRIDPVDDGVTKPSEFPLTMDLALRFVGGIRVKLVPRPRPSTAAG